MGHGEQKPQMEHEMMPPQGQQEITHDYRDSALKLYKDGNYCCNFRMVREEEILE